MRRRRRRGDHSGSKAEETSKEAAKETEAEKKDDAKETEAAKGGEEINKRIAYVVGNLGDKSFNDSGEVGMNVLREKGWDCKTIEVGDPSKADKWEDMILDVIDEGYYYIVASSTYTDIILKLAEEYPENRFVIFDRFQDESESPENVVFILLRTERRLLHGWPDGSRYDRDRRGCRKRWYG